MRRLTSSSRSGAVRGYASSAAIQRSDRGWVTSWHRAKSVPTKLGHTPHIHEWEIPAPRGNIAAWMEERHDKADHILCVISQVYLEQGLLKLGAPRGAVGSSERAAEFRSAGLRREMRSADAASPCQALRPFWFATKRKLASALGRIPDAGRGTVRPRPISRRRPSVRRQPLGRPETAAVSREARRGVGARPQT